MSDLLGVKADELDFSAIAPKGCLGQARRPVGLVRGGDAMEADTDD